MSKFGEMYVGVSLLLFVCLLGVTHQDEGEELNAFTGEGCLADQLFQTHYKPQIAAIAPDVHRILEHVLSKQHSGETYEALAGFVDRFGARFTGTANLEASIDHMLNWLKAEGHENVHGENVTVPRWTRGEEWAEMVKPRHKKVRILGLGYSVGTQNKTIEAPIVVVKTYEELEQRAAEVKNKIVVYNFEWEAYEKQAKYREYGAAHAAKHGAIAALIRSLASLSIDSPHTGGQTYDPKIHKIPVASITVEDAALFQRLTDRKEEVTIRLYSENHLDPIPGLSRNTVSELVGNKYPKEVVLVSGHLDSWDVTQGAMDDGGGAFISWRALSIIKRLGLKPKRTLRSVLWTGEEMGLIGAKAYVKAHQNELKSISVAMESDSGTFTPTGLAYSGTNRTAHCAMHEIMKLMAPINATRLSLRPDGSDVMFLYAEGVPVASLDNENDRYFYYHHTSGDSMNVLNPKVLDKCQAFWTAVSYALASLDDLLPDPRKPNSNSE